MRYSAMGELFWAVRMPSTAGPAPPLAFLGEYPPAGKGEPTSAGRVGPAGAAATRHGDPPGQAQADRCPSPSRPVTHTPSQAASRGYRAVSACLIMSGSLRGVLVTITVTRVDW